MAKILMVFVVVILLIFAAAGFILYTGETEKNRILRAEVSKTAEESQDEIKRLKAEVKASEDKDTGDKQKVLDQMTQYSKERDAAVKEAEALKERLAKERSMSQAANGDLNSLRQELVSMQRESEQGIEGLAEGFKKKKQSYESRILSLEAQLSKIKNRFTLEADRYHYNLGVLYTQNKDFEAAVKEFTAALGFNPRNALAHYNLGIIYDDYFKDKVNARLHYSSYLQLDPVSDDAEAVKEWLANLDK
jgi:tetratricopeptide (TPR) repeat protein